MSLSTRYTTQILNEYQQRRNRAEEEAKQRRRQIEAAIPRMRFILSELENTGLHAVQAAWKAGKSGKSNPAERQRLLKELRTNNQKLLAEKTTLLKNAGYPADYLDVHYTCPDCQDTGFLGSQKCRCFEQRLIELAYQQSNLKSVLSRENFHTFDLNCFSEEPFPGEISSPRENIRRIYQHSQEYARNFPNNTPANLLFYGDIGTGKTFLSNCIAKEVLDRGYTVLYLSAYDLCNAFEKYHFSNKTETQAEDSIQSLVSDTDLLIIDDLGTEFSTSLTITALFYCINQRLLMQKSTIISTNKNLDQLITIYSERVTSRIIGNYQIFKFYGKDLRRS